jgi:hypothetical protein
MRRSDGSDQNKSLDETFPGFAEIPGAFARLVKQIACVG